MKNTTTLKTWLKKQKDKTEKVGWKFLFFMIEMVDYDE